MIASDGTKIPAVEILLKGIQCDAAGCTYSDMTPITREDIGKFLNAPCPMCGAPLLTEDDLFAVFALLGMSDALNIVYADTKISCPISDRVIKRIKVGGTGKVDFA